MTKGETQKVSFVFQPKIKLSECINIFSRKSRMTIYCATTLASDLQKISLILIPQMLSSTRFQFCMAEQRDQLFLAFFSRCCYMNAFQPQQQLATRKESKTLIISSFSYFFIIKNDTFTFIFLFFSNKPLTKATDPYFYKLFFNMQGSNLF